MRLHHSQYTIDSVTGCWNWNASKQPNGYGKVYHWPWTAHKFAWVLENGEIPGGLQVDHTCLNKACVNVAHMELTTQRENLRRAGCSKLSDVQVRDIKHLLSAGKMTQLDIGAQFGVGQTAIARIAQGKTYKEIV